MTLAEVKILYGFITNFFSKEQSKQGGLEFDYFLHYFIMNKAFTEKLRELIQFLFNISIFHLKYVVKLFFYLLKRTLK